MIRNQPLSDFLTEYTLRNDNNQYKPVAVGRYGIRTRDSIYTKELAKDYSKNKVIYQDTLTVGMGSVQIDIGILTEDIRYSVSPAYHTYQIRNINPAYLRYCLECRNQDMFTRFVKRGSRQGKSIDLKRWLTYEIPVFDERKQAEIVAVLDRISTQVANRQEQLELFEQLVKSRFIELFGDPKSNPKGYPQKQLGKSCKVTTGNTPSRAVAEYYGDHIEWIKTDNIVSGLISPTTATEYLSEKGMIVGRTVESGSILMACIAGSVSSIGRVCVTNRKVAFNQQINAIVPYDYNVLFLYAMLQLSKEYLVDGVNMALKGILSKSKLEEKSFFVPPIELQEQFASFVEQADKSKYFIQSTIENYLLIKKSSWREKHDYN